jgi:hypothetical protein
MRSGVAKIIRIGIICQRCHSIHHWGLTQQLVAEGRISRQDERALIKHFLTVNGCKRKDFDRHVDESFRRWDERNEKTWRVDWGDFLGAIRQAKAARSLWRKRHPKATRVKEAGWKVLKTIRLRDLVRVQPSSRR